MSLVFGEVVCARKASGVTESSAAEQRRAQDVRLVMRA
jgi:hypothetical protein